MRSDTLAQLFASLGASTSFSRPRISDDNPFSEAQFKTLKYQPDYPGLFEGELHGRGYLQDFFGWHNDEHHHSGLALFTPADVFFGRVEVVRAARQGALDAEVHINPITAEAVSVLAKPSNDVAMQTVVSEFSSTSRALVDPPTTSAPRLRGTSPIASNATSISGSSRI